MKFKRSLGVLCAASLLAGCSSNPVPDQKEPQTEPTVVQLDDQQRSDGFALSWSLYNRLQQKDENSLFSPLSAIMALGMVENGISGSTLKEMEQALGLDPKQFNTIAKASFAQSEDEKKMLALANSMWVNKELASSLNESYQNLLKEDYHGEAFLSDFAQKDVYVVNSWISDHTDGQIQNIIKNLNDDTAVLLINALSFEAPWMDEFTDAQVQLTDFTDIDGVVKSVPMLCGSEYSYIETDQLEGCRLPYENPRYSLILLLPKEEDLNTALEKTDAAPLLKAVNESEGKEVNFKFPQFELEQKLSLIDPLKEMGMNEIFENGDFSGMMSEDSSRLFISNILQKSLLTFNQKGTKGASTTEVEIKTTSAMPDENPIELTYDRPFFYIVMDERTNVPVFMGSVQKADCLIEK